MLLAELEIFHTRPAVPTRRVALGHMVLPVEPPPGFGGVLLGAVVAQHIVGVHVDLLPDVRRLIDEVERGERIVQPRLRHRYQADRHGLSHSRHRLVGEGDDIEFDFAATGSDLAQVLGAIYATERLDVASRHLVAPVLRKSMRWRGPIGPALIAYLGGSQAHELASLADPLAWALTVLGFPPGSERPTNKEITRSYRTRMRAVHPDHGGDRTTASKEILDLNAARRILSRKEP
ncbi:MAG TPA: J domain-containing protein [Ilumatobacter sp.]|nr:J domain-containing protein [Ilumatobacter sp.]